MQLGKWNVCFRCVTHQLHPGAMHSGGSPSGCFCRVRLLKPMHSCPSLCHTFHHAGIYNGHFNHHKHQCCAALKFACTSRYFPWPAQRHCNAVMLSAAASPQNVDHFCMQTEVSNFHNQGTRWLVPGIACHCQVCPKWLVRDVILDDAALCHHI